MMRATVQDTLRVAEDRLWGANLGALRSALHCPTTDALIGASFFQDYSFATMADDERLAGEREPPALLAAAWEVARSAGMWWPFEHAAVISERPAEVHLNAEHLLERGDGPAVVFRDGRRAYAWNGKAVPERWIVEPEKIPPRDLKGFDASFRAFVESKVGKRKPAKKGTKASALLDRYRAGDHRGVWTDLVALGADVCSPPHAADALAVTQETMRRVKANVRTIVQRLDAMGYVFASKATPSASPANQIRAFEKQHGLLPLSLRAFYEIVGEVNLIGTHPDIDPEGNTIATDPLVVYGFDERLVEYDDDDGLPSSITIAPDDLHKANTSGGDSYEMVIPSSHADGELLNERHGLLFVDYLRLAFRFGGFPGYEGIVDTPHVLAELARDLEPF
jgi:hypothetical protein